MFGGTPMFGGRRTSYVWGGRSWVWESGKPNNQNLIQPRPSFVRGASSYVRQNETLENQHEKTSKTNGNNLKTNGTSHVSQRHLPRLRAVSGLSPGCLRAPPIVTKKHAGFSLQMSRCWCLLLVSGLSPGCLRGAVWGCVWDCARAVGGAVWGCVWDWLRAVCGTVRGLLVSEGCGWRIRGVSTQYS